MSFKVCILAAGIGSRMGQYTQNLNKALLPINGKAVISHIIEKFPADTEFIVATGYLADQVESYLKLAHEHHNISTVTVDKYAGVGSGPGYSLSKCRDLLGNSAFFFVACDTLWNTQINFDNLKTNWVGVQKVPSSLSDQYCNFIVENNNVIEIKNKKNVSSVNSWSFVGLAYIADSKLFWNSLNDSNEFINNEMQMVDGFSELVSLRKLETMPIDWLDVGSAEKYLAECQKYLDFDFSKPDENIYFINGKVIKFFSNESITNDRVKKADINPSVFPESIKKQGQFYSYSFQSGETLYKFCNKEIFASFLNWVSNKLWIKKEISSDVMTDACMKFYKEKTLQRVMLYKKKYTSEATHLDNEHIPTIEELLSQIDWNKMYNGQAFFIHGDLQPDNIIYDKDTNKFTLLDWRQDFSGHKDFGDLYYDLSKLMGGLLLNYDKVKKMKFEYKEDSLRASIKFVSHDNFEDLILIYNSFLKNHQYSLAKINLLVGLIYINMAPLHQYPFDKMLQILGRKLIFKNIVNFNQEGS